MGSQTLRQRGVYEVVLNILKLFKNNEKGASMIEFAIVLPILLALLIGIVEFGWILNGHITITGAAREGARVAVVGEEERIEAVVKDHIEPLNIIGLKIEPDIGDFGNVTSVTVSGGLNSLTGFVGGEGSIIPLPKFYPVDISSKSSMRQEQHTGSDE